MKSVYLIGSLRNPQVPGLGILMRNWGLDVFDDWYAAGPEADDKWQEYETTRGRTYSEALEGYAARHVYHFDRYHLDRCDAGILFMPAGKSGHLELGYMAGQGKPTFVYFPEGEPERWDVMYQFSKAVFCLDELEEAMRNAGLLGEQLCEPEAPTGSQGAFRVSWRDGVQWVVGTRDGQPRLRRHIGAGR